MSEWFHVGQKVLCIASAEDVEYCKASVPTANVPAAGGVYTVREIRDDAPWLSNRQHKIMLLLQECDNSHLIGTAHEDKYCHVEPGFRADRFRPLREKTTDISIFKAMLVTPPKQGVDA